MSISRGRRLLTRVSVWRADRSSDLFSSQTLGELKFFAGDRCCFSGRNKMKSREDRQEDSHFTTYICGIYFPHVSCQR